MIKWDEIELDYGIREDILKKITHVPGEPEMKESESAFLCGLINKYNPKVVTEVGIASGATSAIMLNCLSKLGGKRVLNSIDYSKEFYRDNSKTSGFLGSEAYEIIDNDEIQHNILLGDVACVHESYIKESDMVVIDTVHSLPGEVLDFLTILPILKNGTVVVLHDVAWHLKGRLDFTYATGLLYSNVCAEVKYINHDNNRYPNIAAFVIDDNTHRNIDDLFLSLTVTWAYIPDKRQIDEYRASLNRYFDKRQVEFFDEILRMQKMVYASKNKLFRFPYASIEPNDRVIIYGAGAVGKEYYRQAKVSNCCEIIAWVDKKYESMPTLRVDSLDALNTMDYDYVIIAIENEETVSEVKIELLEMGIPENKIKWNNPRK